MKTFIIKSLLTSLCQREEYFPSIKRGLRGVFLHKKICHSGLSRIFLRFQKDSERVGMTTQQ
jgi:hypothetical protein